MTRPVLRRASKMRRLARMKRRYSISARATHLSVVFLVVSTIAGHARADEADEAYKLGVEDRRAHKDAEALEQFQLAQRLRPSPRSLAQIGLAEHALGRWQDAARDLQSALQVKDDPWIEKNRAVLEEALKKVRTHLPADGSGSEPSAAAPSAPSTGVMPPVPATAAPAAPTKANSPSPSGSPSVAAAAAPIASSASQPTSPQRDVLAAPPAAESTQSHTGAWLALGGAVAFATVGVASTLVRERAVETFNDNSQCFYGDQTRAQRCGSVLSRAKVSGVLSVVGYGGAAVLGGVAAYLWLKPSDESKGQLGFSVGPDRAMAVYRLPLGAAN